MWKINSIQLYWLNSTTKYHFENKPKADVFADIQLLLLYLISKCVHAIGQNHVTWRTLNRNIALTRHYCLNEYSRMSKLPSLIIHVSLIFQNKVGTTHDSTDKSKSQIFASSLVKIYRTAYLSPSKLTGNDGYIITYIPYLQSCRHPAAAVSVAYQ